MTPDEPGMISGRTPYELLFKENQELHKRLDEAQRHLRLNDLDCETIRQSNEGLSQEKQELKKELHQRRVDTAKLMVDYVMTRRIAEKLYDAAQLALATEPWTDDGEKTRNALADLLDGYRETRERWEAEYQEALKHVDQQRERPGDVPPVQSALSDLPADADGFRRPPIVRNDPDLYQKPTIEPPTQPPGGGPGLPTEKK